jgi:two-component system, NtrC family, sensor histidine kinase KinB
MALSIKNKLRFGTLFLFLLLMFSAGFSIYYLLRLKETSRNVLKDNYETLEYGHNMLRQLDSMHKQYQSALSKFEANLKLQENNVTEYGEEEATKTVRKTFDKIVSGENSDSAYEIIRNNIQKILDLNMAAIERKNKKAEQSSESATAIIFLIAAICFIVGLTFSFNFPGIVTTPISKFADAIRQISKRNYKHRVHLDNKDEFGQLAGAFNDMAERLEEFESSNLNRVLFEKARAEAVINSLKDASIGIDKNNYVLFANQQALQLLGLKAEEAVGKSIDELSKRNDLFKFLIENENTSPFKIIVDGKENYYVKELIEVDQGETKNKVIVLKNITSFKELDVAKTDFIATISHELKTPLASSDFSLKLLEDDRIGKEEQKELIQQLKNDNQRMLRILSELLNMSQLEAGKIQLDIQSVNPSQIIENSINAVAATAKEKELNIEKNIQSGLPDIKADSDKLNWVLNNFLTNAIKYSPSESTITIDVKQADHNISFAVTDRGQGIDEAYLGRIFERYFQVPGRSDKKGSGIGLAICKEFIEAMGGHIWVKSRIGEGSSFGFDVPVA